MEISPVAEPTTAAGPDHRRVAPVSELAIDGDTRQPVLQIDAAMEDRVVRKIDLHLLPLLMALYLLSSLDRSNIGNAKTAGMNQDLGLSGAQYQWLLTIFYIPYILFEWLALMWKLVPPHIWAAATVFTWGLAATLQALAFDWAGMMAARAFLAVAECGFAPGIPFLMSFYYLRPEIGRRIGIFLSAAPLATCFSGALAYAITRPGNRLSISSWRLLFLVEGIPTCIMAIVVFFSLPDSPGSARFLTPEDKQVARARAMRQTGVEGQARIGRIDFRDVGAALLDIKNWLTALMYFSCNVSFASLPVFTPTILEGMGFTSIRAQGLTAPPYFFSFCVCIASTYVSDRTEQRGLTIIFLSLVGTVGYVLLATVQATPIRYFAIFLAAGGVFPSICNIVPWVLNNQGSDTKRGAGIAILQIVGQCGPLLGTSIFPDLEGPYYVRGMAICAAFMFFNAALALALREYLRRGNIAAQRREQALEPGDRAEKNARGEREVAVENEGWGYRYML